MLRDRLVCGINDNSIQKRLLVEGDKLTLATAVTLAQSYESAVHDATMLLPIGESQHVHAMSPKGQNKTQRGSHVIDVVELGTVPQCVISGRNAVTAITKLVTLRELVNQADHN